MIRHLPWKILLRALAIFLLSPPLLNAEVTGTVSGTVTDASGATIGNAPVVLRNANTGLERRVQTNASGGYEFLAGSESKLLDFEPQCKPTSSSKSIRSTEPTSS